MESIATHSVKDYLETLASPSPTPGGGAVAAITAAQCAALLSMVASIADKTGDPNLLNIRSAARKVCDLALRSAADDASAFESVMEALRMPKTCPAEQEARKRHLESASIAAARVPLDLLASLLEIMRHAETLEPHVGPHLISDLGIIAHLAQAAAISCRYTVLINLKTIKDPSHGSPIQRTLEQTEADLTRIAQSLAARVETRLKG